MILIAAAGNEGRGFPNFKLKETKTFVDDNNIIHSYIAIFNLELIRTTVANASSQRVTHLKQQLSKNWIWKEIMNVLSVL